jgi:hypothetical protein
MIMHAADMSLGSCTLGAGQLHGTRMPGVGSEVYILVWEMKCAGDLAVPLEARKFLDWQVLKSMTDWISSDVIALCLAIIITHAHSTNFR